MWVTKYFEITQKITWIGLNTIHSVFINVSKKFDEYIRTENPSYKIAWNYSKFTEIVLNIIFSVFKIFTRIHKNGKFKL